MKTQHIPGHDSASGEKGEKMFGKTVYKKTCTICGKEYTTTGTRSKACSKECRKILTRSYYNYCKTPYDRAEKETRKAAGQSLQEVANAARSAGMSYGQYVASMGGKR